MLATSVFICPIALRMSNCQAPSGGFSQRLEIPRRDGSEVTDFRQNSRFLLIHPFSLEIQTFGGARETSENRRFSQQTVGGPGFGSVTLGL